MRPFEVLETADLLHALADYTSRYTRMLAEGGNRKDMINCKETIQSLLSEVEIRKQQQSDRDPSSEKNR